jgi:hypothetical protein
MYENRFQRDDIIPMLRDDGIAATLAPWIAGNASEEFVSELIQMKHSVILLHAQIRQVIADLAGVGALEGIDVIDLPNSIDRPAAPTGIGCAGGNVWVTPPGTNYVLRFYVNGVHKSTLTDYYITDLASIGAVVGDVIQVAEVIAGVVGWWARIIAV